MAVATSVNDEKTKVSKTKTTITPQAKQEDIYQLAAKRETYVYLGPSLQTYPLRQGANYVGGIPKQFQSLYDSNENIRMLFVRLDESLDVRRELRDPYSEHSFAFNAIKESGV